MITISITEEFESEAHLVYALELIKEQIQQSIKSGISPDWEIN